MTNKIISRIISGGIWGILMGLWLYIDHSQGQQLGKDAFLVKEAARYDRHFARPESVIVDIIASLILFCILFTIYEIVAFAIFKLLEQINPPANN
ncbi:MAG TPA: hypothetical protein VMH87_03850 [Pseudomonadales bacterium]|nr:hypothetical protein [Pseudomonadales bacterium]